MKHGETIVYGPIEQVWIRTSSPRYFVFEMLSSSNNCWGIEMTSASALMNLAEEASAVSRKTIAEPSPISTEAWFESGAWQLMGETV